MDEGLPGHSLCRCLSATPWARGLGKYYDDFIVEATTHDLTSARVICRLSSPLLRAKFDLAGVRTVAGDFHETQPAEAVDQPKLVGDAHRDLVEARREPPDALLRRQSRSCRAPSAPLRRGWSAAEYIDCFTDRLDRERILDRFRAGEMCVICNAATLAVGL